MHTLMRGRIGIRADQLRSQTALSLVGRQDAEGAPQVPQATPFDAEDVVHWWLASERVRSGGRSL